MSLPYSSIVPISATVEGSAFTVEKKHMLLAMVTDLMPTSEVALEFAGSSAVADFGAYFGKNIPEYAQVQKYFGFLSKNGNAPEKVVVARWFKEASTALIRGGKVTATVAQLAGVVDGVLPISVDGAEEVEVAVNLAGSVSMSDVASKIQEAVQSSFGQFTCEFNSTTGGFLMTSGTVGSGTSIKIGAVTELTRLMNIAGSEKGANAETFAEFCDRIYKANTAGYSITTLEELDDIEIEQSVEWLQGHFTANRLVFNIKDKATAKALDATLSGMSYTGFVICYDPKGEYINILDCAICGSIDYEVANGAINFNFQPAVGYSAITDLGTVVDYQQGLTNDSLANDLIGSHLNFVYSVGFGNQEQIFYGWGYMAGDFGTEDVQVNESALEQELQVSIINALASLNKIKLQGTDAKTLVGSLIAEPLNKFRVNGSIAMNGTLTNADKVSIAQATGNPDASTAVANNGYYYQVQPLSAEDIAKRRVRVLICYLSAGVVNQVRIINRIYGA